MTEMLIIWDRNIRGLTRVESVEFCCSEMKEIWNNDIRFNAFHKSVRLKTDVDPTISYCPFCGARIVVMQER